MLLRLSDLCRKWACSLTWFTILTRRVQQESVNLRRMTTAATFENPRFYLIINSRRTLTAALTPSEMVPVRKPSL